MANSIICFLSFFVFICFSLPTSVTPSSSDETDLISLLAIKSSLTDPKGALNSWAQTTHYCNWTGIQCGRRRTNRVIKINLQSQSLVGSLSPYIGNLSFLRLIDLQNNTFNGPIPQEISYLRRLEFVNFSNNSFFGSIPKNLSRCTNLFHLNLIDNKLSGTIPNELGSLYKLQHLGLGVNTFSGPIPSFLGNLTSLVKLGLSFSSQGGEIPESFVKLKRLEKLFLGRNNLTGTIPPGLFNISTLVHLSVNENQLQGSIPSTIGLTLPNLQVFNLYDNQFTGPIPVSLSNATSLVDITFAVNYFTGRIPRDLGKLSRLQIFICEDNQIQDDISFISSFTNCTNQQDLEVGHNLLTGSLPGTIANLSRHLETFLLQSTQIHGRIPSGIGNLVSLTGLNLSNNNLEGPIPSAIGKLSKLQSLDLRGNRFINELPYSFGNLTSLSELYLNDNNFSRTIPRSLGNCTKLLELDLSRNNLDGLIPPELVSLSSLSISLSLSYNKLTGSIPPEVGSLRNLGVLDLSNNRLSGVIQNSLGTCTSLERLHLEGNLFEGQIPSELSSLMGLQDLDLSCNNLSGMIPSVIGQLRLTNLNLSFNKLHGEVPIRGVFTNRSAVSIEGNNELCGGIPELKLPHCTNSSNSSKIKVSTLLKILIPTCSAVVALFICFIIFLYRQRTAKKPLSSLPSFVNNQFLRLSFADLFKATGGFSENNLIGVGRFGSVYRGILDDGVALVAVKVLDLFVRGASKSFMAECDALRGTRHRNLVKILSVCESIDFQGNNFKALVYEYKANGSLEKWMYQYREEGESGEKMRRKLSMIERFNIAIDIAQAMEYLHYGTDLTFVHGDLKPSNILLDDEMTACVGDFGLAKIVSQIVPSHESTSSIGIRGTLGYIPPEYGMSNSVSTQGDAYSYGIILLEIFTNIRPTDNLFQGHGNLHSFVSAALSDHVMEIVDPIFQAKLDVENGKIIDCMSLILSIGVSCSKEMPKDRMSMTDVVVELLKIKKFLSS